MRALLIDDDRLDRRRICRMLKSIDPSIDVTEVPDALAALDLLEAESFDCMLVDQRMPGIIGTELIRGLRAPANASEIPIIVLSGEDACSWVAHEAISAGGDIFLAKQDLTADRLQAAFLQVVGSAGGNGPETPQPA